MVIETAVIGTTEATAAAIETKVIFPADALTQKSTRIHLFNKLSDWTYQDWLDSDARHLLDPMPNDMPVFITLFDMTDEEKAAHPEAGQQRGFLRGENSSSSADVWWRELSDGEKEAIMSIPNFDKTIFKEITGIDIDE